MVASLLMGMLPMLLTAYMALMQSRNNSSDEAYARLESLRESKKAAVEDFANNIINQIRTLSATTDIRKGLISLNYSLEEFLEETEVTRDFNDPRIQKFRSELTNFYRNDFLSAYKAENSGESTDISHLINELSPEALVLQHTYIYSNPAQIGQKDQMMSSDMDTSYDTVHGIVHPTLKKFREAFGYNEIFMVDSETGRIVYSVYKNIDFATSLIDGPHAKSPLGRAFREANSLTNLDDYVLFDYEQYLPAYNNPASFIASPIFDGDEKIGVLIFEMPMERISEMTNTRYGMGETGEAYLVGSDQFMRSDSYKNPDSLSVINSFKAKETVNSESIMSALQGKTGISESRNYQDEKVLSGFTPVKFGKLDWALVVEIETAEAFAAISSLTWKIFGLSIIASLALIAFAVKFSMSVVKPIDAMRKTITEVANTGDFSRRVDVVNEDEIGQSSISFNSMLENFEGIIREVNGVVGGMARGDFQCRVNGNAKGDLANLKDGVNASASSIAEVVSEVNHVVAAIADGDFDQRVNADLQGELAQLKNGVNKSASTVDGAMSELGELMDAMGRGDFKRRVSVELSGAYASFGRRADRAMESVDRALMSIDRVISNVARGQIDSRVEESLPGQLAEIKNNINDSLETLTQVFSETGKVLASMAAGDLREKITSEFEGAFGQLKADANATVSKLTEVVDDIRQSSYRVQVGAEDIAQGNNNLSQRTEQQAMNLEETAQSMDEITSTVKNTAINANNANDLVMGTRQQAQRGGEVVNEAVEAMKKVNAASNRIAEIISVIDEIAFQTNLLALNASVEAARAGEHGKGFAVVANEVRNLAGRSATAAKEIKDLIEDSVAKTDVGFDLVTRSGSTLEEIVSSVENVTNIVGEIATAAEEQSVGVSEVHKSIAQLQSLTQQNTSLVEEAAAASEDLDGQSRVLNDLVGFFINDKQESKKQKLIKSVRKTDEMLDKVETKLSQPVKKQVSAQVAFDDNHDEDEWKEF